MLDMSKADALVLTSVFYTFDPSCKNVGEGAALANEVINAAQSEYSYETSYFNYKALMLSSGSMMMTASLK